MIGASTAPAMPARPEPKMKIIMSICAVSMPRHPEIARLRRTARTLSPKIGLENHVEDQEQQQDRHARSGTAGSRGTAAGR